MANGRGNSLDDLLWRADHPGIDPETGRPWWEVSEREDHLNVTQSDLEASGLEVARMAMGLARQAYLACKHPDEWPGGTYIYEGEVLEAYHRLYLPVITMESNRRHMRYAAEEKAAQGAAAGNGGNGGNGVAGAAGAAGDGEEDEEDGEDGEDGNGGQDSE